MSEIKNACKGIALSRDRLRLALRDSAAAPVNTKTPFHLAGLFAKDALQAAVQPVAQRNPLALVLGAAVAGVVLVWSRPWRWLLSPALLATLLPQITSRIFNHGVPIPWMKLLSSLAKPHKRQDAQAGSRLR